MEQYATISDLESGWRVLEAHERGRADVLLLRASVYLDSVTRGRFRDAASEYETEVAKTITCNVVRRCLGGKDPVTATPEWSVDTFPTEQVYSSTTTVGEMWLSKSDWDMIHSLRGYIASVPMG